MISNGDCDANSNPDSNSHAHAAAYRAASSDDITRERRELVSLEASRQAAEKNRPAAVLPRSSVIPRPVLAKNASGEKLTKTLLFQHTNCVVVILDKDAAHRATR
jgi:hypothetical protein